jgi:hypothetical protein
MDNHYGFLINGKIPLIKVEDKDVHKILYNGIKDLNFNLEEELSRYKEVLNQIEDNLVIWGECIIEINVEDGEVNREI